MKIGPVSYIRDMLFVMKLVYRSFKVAHAKMKDPNLREISRFRHVLVVGQRVKGYPHLVVARHFCAYQNHPDVEDALELKRQVIEDKDLREGIPFEGEPNYPDLVVMCLANFSNEFINGLMGIMSDVEAGATEGSMERV